MKSLSCLSLLLVGAVAISTPPEPVTPFSPPEAAQLSPTPGNAQYSPLHGVEIAQVPAPPTPDTDTGPPAPRSTAAGSSTAESQIQVSGPREANVGDLVVLQAVGENIDKWVWMPDQALKGKVLTFEDGQRIVFATGTPGVYEMILAGSVREGDASSRPLLARWSVSVSLPDPNPPGPDPGPGPDPDPSPTPTPTPTPPTDPLGLKIYNAAAQVVSPQKQQEAKQLADIFSAVAGQAAGVASMTVPEMLSQTSNRMKTELSAETRQRWQPWEDQFPGIMREAGLTTKEQHIAAWNNIADALGRVQ